MELRYTHTALLLAALASLGASYRTQNFVVRAATPELARELAHAAEQIRDDLAMEWLGETLGPIQNPCLIHADVGANLTPSGLTQAQFGSQGVTHAQVFVQGSRDRILRSVLPHEITHLIFASAFGPAIPRWADEGASITVEHQGEQLDQQRLLLTIVDRGQAISFNRLFSLHEYPVDSAVMYTQGFSLTQFLVAQGGRMKFTQYLHDGMRWNDWNRATKTHYAVSGLPELEKKWKKWVLANRELTERQALAQAPAAAPAESPVVRPASVSMSRAYAY